MFESAFLQLPPLESAGGTIRLPGSKSISNRVLLLAALSQGTTVIHDLLDSDDTRVMMAALRQLGCSLSLEGTTATVTGLGGVLQTSKPIDFFMGNAGTAIRPLTAALALLGGDFTLKGIPRMHERPIGDLVDALRLMGCQIDYLDQEGFPPLRLHNPQPVNYKNHAPIHVRGDVSSQFLTALLLTLPLAARQQEIVIQVEGELISKPYIEITLNLLQRFGIHIRRNGWTQFVISQNSSYVSPKVIYVEGDASSASYFMALGAIAPGHGIRIEGVGSESIQGDIQFAKVVQNMGASVQLGPNWLHIQKQTWPLKSPGIIDCGAIPDAAMTLAMLALYADQPTTLTNIGSWRVKETDRIAAMAKELNKLGAKTEETLDSMTVYPLKKGAWRATNIHTYDDHRMAMCFSLASLNPDKVAIQIEDPKCVAKTFPDYFETFFSMAQTNASHIPVICIDGPTASGKGTLASAVAKKLGYHYLDSGALYRLVGHAAVLANIDLNHADRVAEIAQKMQIAFQKESVWLNGADVTQDIRTELAGINASKISVYPAVREALLNKQLQFRKLPGLVADGRDMGTIVFPNATLKIFLTAHAEIRAQRRYNQLISKGISASIAELCAALKARDARDYSRDIAPLTVAKDALVLDNSDLSIEDSVTQILKWFNPLAPNQF